MRNVWWIVILVISFIHLVKPFLQDKGENTEPRVLKKSGANSPKQRAAKMVKFLKPNKAVILGRYARRKAVIVRSFDDETHNHLYDHCLIARGSKYLKKVIHKDSQKKLAKKSHVDCKSREELVSRVSKSMSIIADGTAGNNDPIISFSNGAWIDKSYRSSTSRSYF